MAKDIPDDDVRRDDEVDSSDSPPVSQFDFDDLKVIEIPVKHEGKEYILREATAEASRQWRNAVFRVSKRESSGEASVRDGGADLETLLVHLCLWEQYEHKGTIKERNVPLATIRSWRNRVVRPLFRTAAEISELGEFSDTGESSDTTRTKPESTSPPRDLSQEGDSDGEEKKPKHRTMWS